MNITFRVIDTRTDEDITEKSMWVLRPDGSLAYNDYGDLTGCIYAKAVIEEAVGEWEYENYHGVEFAKCSSCKQGRTIPSLWTFNDIKRYNHYCPFCGIKMRGV